VTAPRQGGKVGGAGGVPGGGDARAARPATRAVRPAATWKAGKAGDAGGVPSGKAQGWQSRRQGLTPWVPIIMIDPACMAVDGGNANGEAHMAHAVAGEGRNVDRSTAPEMLGQFQPCGSYDAHVDPVEVVDGIPGHRRPESLRLLRPQPRSRAYPAYSRAVRGPAGLR